jgi:hypothetical protein
MRPEPETSSTSSDVPPKNAPQGAAAAGEPLSAIEKRLQAGLSIVLLGSPGEGDWVGEVRAFCARTGFLGLTLGETLEAISRAPAAIVGALPDLPPTLAEQTPGWIRQGATGATLQRLRFLVKASNPDAGDALAAEAYVLLRSAIFLLDGDAGGIDLLGPAQYASKMGVPLWIISSRVAVSPWLLAYADAVVRPSALVDMLRATLNRGR